MGNLNLSISPTVEALKNKKIVCIPTDTIYGLSVSAYEKQLLKKVSELKGRTSPFILLMDSLNKIRGILNEIPVSFLKLKAARLIPGPITMLLRVRVKVDYIVSSEGKVAVRIPSMDFLQKVLRELDFPIISTSANISGKPPARTIDDARKYFGRKVDLYIDGGELGGYPSTIIDLTEDSVKLIREGSIPFNNIIDALKKTVNTC